jgi:hypothetical protein
MKKELDERLTRLQLEQYRSITDRTENDCLFIAAIDRIREYAYNDRTRNKALVAAGEGHVTSVMQDPNGLDVTLRILDVTGLRNFIALAGLQHVLKPTSRRTQLLNHMRHRFANGICESDAALPDVEGLPQEPTEVQIVTKWTEIITKGGVCRSP